MKEIIYTVSFGKPFTHYCEVEILLENANESSLTFSMPVWTPGSYLVREFSKNVEGITAENKKGDKLSLQKINKNSWKVECPSQDSVSFKYRVYCNELTVRTSNVNSEHALLNGAGVFMFVKGYEKIKCILKINLPAEWKEISTGLDEVSENKYSAENYDVLIDCPVEIGNQEILKFKIQNVEHFICIVGKGNYNSEKLLDDFKKIAEEEIKLFGGEIPYKHFTFIIHLVEKGGGGLEHLNSFVAQMVRWNFNDEKLYKKFLGLVSHEFFHLWNVKRIRPEALGPFAYDKENYTTELWVAEGWTSFYDNLILRRCSILDNNEYFEFVDVEVNDVLRFKGQYTQSLSESSFDTWIKFYRKNENYNNAEISYYTKGAIVALMLNIEIIKTTDAKYSLDDCLRTMYEDYKKDVSTGYSSQRVKEVCEKVSGKNLSSFWDKYINGVEEMPLESYLNDCGLKLVNENEDTHCTLDIELKPENGRFITAKVLSGGSAYESGVNTGDEFIAINNIRIHQEMIKTLLKDCVQGDVIKILVSRGGILKELDVKLLRPMAKYKIQELEEESEEQRKFLEKWIEGN